MAFPPETEAQIGAKPKGSLQGISGALAEDIAISMIPGLGDGLFDSEGNRHTSTYVKTYKNIDGKWQETPFTINDINSNDFVFLIGSKTGGENRERVAQNYRLQDGKFTPVGKPSYYKGAQDIGFFEGFVREGLPFVVSFIPGLNVAIGTALGATSAVAAQALGNAVIQASLSVAAGAKPGDALKNAAASFGVSQLVPNLTGNPFIDNALKSGATAALTNGDIGNAITNSLIATGAQAALSNTSITGDPRIDSGLVSGATSVAQAVATGGDPGQSFVRGFISGSTAKINQQESAAGRAASGAGFLGEYDDLSGAGPADYVMGERDPALVQAGFFDSARGLLQSSLAELGKSWLAAGQQVGIAPQTLQRAIDYLSVIEQGGQELIPEDIKAQQQAFISKIYGVASNPNSSATDIGRAVVEATIENPLGSLTLVGSEIMQELPTLLLPGGAIGKLAGFALNIAESAGGQALEKIDELRRANPNMTNQQLIEAARADAGISGLVTAVASLLPGANTKALQPIVEGLKESLEEGITQYILTGDRNAATGSAILGGVIGGKTTGALQTGDQVAEAAQRTFAEVPSLGSITVSSTRLPLDEQVIPDVGETLTITPSVVTKQGATDNVPAPQLPTVVVISTDPTKDTALVIDNSGQTKIVGATDVATGTKVTEGQTLTITSDSKLTSETLTTTPTIKISEGVRREPTTYTGDLQGQRGTGATRLNEFQRTFQGTLYPTVEARNKAMQDYYASLGIRTEPETTAPTDTFTVSRPVVRDDANLADVISKLGSLGFTPTNEVVSQLMAGNPTKAEVNQRIDAQTYNNRFYATAQEAANAKLKDDLIRVGNDLIGQGNSFEEVTSFLNGELGALGLASGITMKNGRPEVMLVATRQVQRSAAPVTSVPTNPAFADAKARIEDAKARAAANTAKAEELTRTFNGTVYPTVEARNKAAADFAASAGIMPTERVVSDVTQNPPSAANLASVVNFLGQMGVTPTNSMVADLMANNATNAQVLQNIRSNAEVRAALDAGSKVDVSADAKALGDILISQGASLEQVSQALNNQLQGTNFRASFTMVDGKPTTNIVEVKAAPRSITGTDYSAYSDLFAGKRDTSARSDLTAKFDASKAQTEVNTRTFQGTVYPTVEARNAAIDSYIETIGQKTLGATPTTSSQAGTDNSNQTANLASVVNFLGQMGITPTQSMMDALMAGNPTNAEVLTRIRSNPEILAAVAARGQQDTFTKVGPGADVDTGTKIVPGGQVVTGGDVKVGGDIVTGGKIVQEQKPAEIDVANQPASQQDVVALLGRMGLPTSAAFVAELTRDNATNAQVLQRLQADPAVQALIRQQRFGQTDTAIVVAVDPSNNTALVIDTKGNTQTIEAVDTKTGQTLVEDQVITVPVVTETAQTFTFDPAASLIQTRFQENGKVATEQDIANLKAIAQQSGIDFSSDTFGTTPAYQRWATLVNDTARGVKPYVAPTVTPEVKVDTGTKVTPLVTESIDLTFDPGRVNIDTPEDTVRAQDTFSFVDTTPVIDTTPTFDTVVDTLPQDTVPTYGEDEDIIKFLGLDQEPTPTEPEAPPAEDTIGGGTGTTNIIPEERLAVAPKPVYTPKPGTRVVDTGTSTGILPTRVQLSEGMGDDVEGTGEEEQQPVWNVRSLKLRRALGI